MIFETNAISTTSDIQACRVNTIAYHTPKVLWTTIAEYHITPIQKMRGSKGLVDIKPLWQAYVCIMYRKVSGVLTLHLLRSADDCRM